MQCVARALFHNRYLITVPNSACYSVGELKDFGIVDRGGEVENKSFLNEPRLVWANIVLIAHHVFNGVPVTLSNFKDGHDIYEIVTTHLDNWIYAASNIPNCKLPPIEDMALLDELAENLCGFNQQHELDEPQSLTILSLYSEAPKFNKDHDMVYEPRMEKLFNLQGRKRRRGR